MGGKCRGSPAASTPTGVIAVLEAGHAAARARFGGLLWDANSRDAERMSKRPKNAKVGSASAVEPDEEPARKTKQRGHLVESFSVATPPFWAKGDTLG